MTKSKTHYKKGMGSLLGLLIIVILLGGGMAAFVMTKPSEQPPPEQPPTNGQPPTTPENGNGQPPTNGQPQIPETIKAIGTIEKLEISAWMYGTHTLSENEKIKYALASEAVDLNQYLNKTVEVEGTLKEGYPVDGGPPYLIVKKMRIIESITVITDKSEYATGEIINITIKNGSPDTVSYWNRVNNAALFPFSIENKIAESWEEIAVKSVCACDISCLYETPGPLELNPGETIERPWTQYKECDEQIEEGTYRIRFDYYHPFNPEDLEIQSIPIPPDAEKLSVYSNEFEIK